MVEELLCSVEILKRPRAYAARIQSQLGGVREYKSPKFEEMLEQVIIDIQEEFEA